MKRQNIEVVIGFLDAVRRSDREAAAEFLDADVFWQGLLPELACRDSREVLDIFLRRREDSTIEIDRLEVIGTPRGAVFAFHRPETWEVEGIEVHGVIYHAAEIADGRISRIADYLEREEAVAAAGGVND